MTAGTEISLYLIRNLGALLLFVVILRGVLHASRVNFYNPLSQLIYATSSSNFTHSWVQGKLLMENRNLTSMQLSGITKRARQWTDRIRGASND